MRPSPDELRVRDMLAAIESIRTHWDPHRFESDELLQSHVLLRIQMIGEAAASMTVELRTAYLEIPWREIVALRNILVHHYWRVELDQVRAIVEDDLPKLRDALQGITFHGPPA